MNIRLSAFKPTGVDNAQPSMTFDKAVRAVCREAGSDKNWAYTEVSEGEHDERTNAPSIVVTMLPGPRQLDMEDQWVVGQILIEALLEENLSAFSRDRLSGEYYEVPPSYWVGKDYKHRPEECENLVPLEKEGRVHWPEGLVGELVLLLEEHFERWKSGAVAKLKTVRDGDGSPLKAARARRKRVTPEQERLLEFFRIARQHMPGGDQYVNDTVLLGKYDTWMRAKHPGIEPLKRTRFNEWLKRWLAGGLPE